MGDHATAIKSYLAVQLAEHPRKYAIPQKEIDALINRAKAQGISAQQVPRQFDVPQDIWYMHARAAEDSKYWIALAQFELGDYHAAVDSFENYQKRYGGQGFWSKSVAVGRAVAQAEDKQFAVAAYSMTRLLQLLAEDDPQRPGLELLAARWRAAHQASKTEVKGETGK
jgi:hypothetical protein